MVKKRHRFVNDRVFFFKTGLEEEKWKSQLITCLAMIITVAFGGIMAQESFEEDIRLGTVQIFSFAPV